MEKDKNANYLKMLTELCPSLIHSKLDALRLETFPCLKEVILIPEHYIEGGDILETPCQGAYHFQEI